MVEAALKNGQEAVDVAIFAFRMTAGALPEQGDTLWLPIWRNLKQGHDLFEADCIPPRLGACRGEHHGQDAEDAQCAAIAAWS